MSDDASTEMCTVANVAAMPSRKLSSSSVTPSRKRRPTEVSASCGHDVNQSIVVLLISDG